jgi:hypothetical protein
MAREYHRLLFGMSERAARSAAAGSALKPSTFKEVRYGSNKAVISEIVARDEQGSLSTVFTNGATAEFAFTVAFRAEIEQRLAYGFIITNARGIEVYGTTSSLFGDYLPPGAAGSSFECRLRVPLQIAPGVYFLTAAIAPSVPDEDQTFLDCRFDALEFEVVGQARCFTTSVADLRGDVSHQALVNNC